MTHRHMDSADRSQRCILLGTLTFLKHCSSPSHTFAPYMVNLPGLAFKLPTFAVSSSSGRRADHWDLVVPMARRQSVPVHGLRGLLLFLDLCFFRAFSLSQTLRHLALAG